MARKNKALSGSGRVGATFRKAGPGLLPVQTEPETASREVAEEGRREGGPGESVGKVVRPQQHEGDAAGRPRLLLSHGRGEADRRRRRGERIGPPRPEGPHGRVEVRRCARGMRHAEAGDAGGGQGQSEAGRYGTGTYRAPVGTAGHTRGVEGGVPHGRPRPQDTGWQIGPGGPRSRGRSLCAAASQRSEKGPDGGGRRRGAAEAPVHSPAPREAHRPAPIGYLAIAARIMPTMAVRMPPLAPPAMIWPMMPAMSRPPACVVARPRSELRIWPPRPPPSAPAMVLPSGPRSTFLAMLPARFPPAAPLSS